MAPIPEASLISIRRILTLASGQNRALDEPRRPLFSAVITYQNVCCIFSYYISIKHEIDPVDSTLAKSFAHKKLL
jgi:hypothetical protein